ncbi:hypothetical protein PHMEG_0005745 [Phytophthora megakarya]|uniref:Reverse transcriptase n=1 Tax=Phytophthora megakarya TaxID=4795 RepID=A0A225WSH2_9STRA|nr:hypothetical protein PHMEG_0005745 [Phytophthora megakarya]
MQVLRKFFSLVGAAQLKLNMAKSRLFEVEVLWCGRLISGAGVRHDPARVSALSTLPLPATVADLQYFICLTNWLRDSLFMHGRSPLSSLNWWRKRNVLAGAAGTHRLWGDGITGTCFSAHGILESRCGADGFHRYEPNWLLDSGDASGGMGSSASDCEPET